MNDYEKAIAKWGKESQIKQAIEELSELITALCHESRERRGHPAENPIEAIIDEVADVEIMLPQIMIIFGISRKQVDQIKMEKFQRLRKMLDT